MEKELRKDLLTNRVVILSQERNNRPMDLADGISINKNEIDFLDKEYNYECPFCRGNEQLTTKETFRTTLKDDKWLNRSVYNKYPILDNKSSKIYGVHEVMIDTYRHNGSFFDMSKEEFKHLILMYKDRYKYLINDDKVKYVSLFKNFLRKSGASLMHPHTQIMSLSIIPPETINEIEIAKEFYEENNISLYNVFIEDELIKNERVIHNNENFIVLAPTASVYSNEICIIYKHKKRFEDLREEECEELGVILKELFNNINQTLGYIPFNLYLHAHPKNINCDDYYNFHIHIVPRNHNFGGFELGTGIYVTSSKPENLTKKIKF